MKNYKAIDQERNGINRRGFIARTLFAAAGSLTLAASRNEASAQSVKRNNTKSTANSPIGRRRLGKLEGGPEKEVIPTCEELGIGFVPWSPLGVQFLTGWIDANTRFAPGDIRGVESRFSPQNLPHNLQLVALVKRWAEQKRATPAQIALAWLLAQKPWIVPIPGTTQMAHMLENSGAAGVRFTPAELAELNSAVRAIEVRGARLPDQVLVFSGVEAPPKK